MQSKYRAVKTVVDGIKFDSKRESEVYKELKLLERAGKIENLRLQVPFPLIMKSKWGREIKYVADFVYDDIEEKKRVVLDVKGFRTDVYRLKKRLFEEMYDTELTERR